MKKERAAFIVFMVFLLAVGMIACGGGGGGGEAQPSNMVSTTSFQHYSSSGETLNFDTDGQWAIWRGRDRDRIMVNDGSSTKNYANGLAELAVNSLNYDGRFLVFRALDGQEPCPDSSVAMADSTNVTSWKRSELYYYDTASSNPALKRIIMTEEKDCPWWIHFVNGMLTYQVYDNVNQDNKIYAYNLSTGTGPVLIHDTTNSTNRYPNTDGNWVVYENDSDEIIAADVQSLGAFSMTDDLVVVASGGVQQPVIGNGIVCWEDTGDAPDNIYCDDLNDNYGTPVNVSSAVPTYGAYDPAIAGSYVSWEQQDGTSWEIYVAYVGDLANFDPAVGTGDVQKLVSDSVRDQNAKMAGDYMVWVRGGELYSAVLSGGIYTDIKQVSVDFEYYYDYYDDHPEYEYAFDSYDSHENFSDDTFTLDDQGNVAWTEILESSESSADIEYVLTTNIDTGGDPEYLPNYNAFQKVKQLNIVDGKTAWLTAGIFTRIFAKQVSGSGDPVAISPAGQMAREAELNGGIVAWSGKPGTICDSDWWDIWYADLNTADKTPVKLSSSVGTKDKKPAVDGVNRIIAWYEDNDDVYKYAFLSDKVTNVITSITADCEPEIDNGWLVVQDDSADVWVVDLFTGNTMRINGDYGCYRRPSINEGIVLWFDDSDYNLWYFDVNGTKPVSTRITENVDFGDTDFWNGDHSGGVVVFQGQLPAGSSTDVIYTYNIGDPVDSVSVLFTMGEMEGPSTGNGIVQVGIDNDLVVWKYAICDPEIYYMRLGDSEATALTENYLPDNKPIVENGVIMWSSGEQDDGNLGNYFIARP